MRRLVASAALALASLALSGCFNVDEPVCSYACAEVEPKCPEDYECRSDGYCHKKGTTGACSFSVLDMSAAAVNDLASSDLAPPTTD
jgi:hypothetical protein